MCTKSKMALQYCKQVLKSRENLTKLIIPLYLWDRSLPGSETLVQVKPNQHVCFH